MIPFDARTATEEDLARLIRDEVREGRDIDFKTALPGDEHDAKREFLADVSSFANAAGGVLILGVEEEAGIAKRIAGLELDDPDAVILRLDSIIRDSVEPRLPVAEIRVVPLSSGRHVVLIYIARSWNAPHVVNYRKHWRFYSRNSAGKYQLDVQEVRDHVLLSSGAADRLVRFRTDRLAKIVSGDMPTSLVGKARLVLHLVPLSALASNTTLAPRTLLSYGRLLIPFNHGSAGTQFNLDGLLTFATHEGDEKYTYVQAFRSGAIELVDGSLLQAEVDGVPILQVTRMEEELLETIPNLLTYLSSVGMSFPLTIMLSVLGIRNYAFWRNHQSFKHNRHMMRMRDMLIPELVLETPPTSVNLALKPIFDALWNAGGYAGTPNIKEDGSWVGGSTRG